MLIGAAAASIAGSWAAGASAETAGQGLLKRLQEAKKARIGIANQPPFSSLNADGTVTGVAPIVSQTILGRLGIPQVEAFVANYGELIPGMMAGRWDFVSASLTITKARCAQVLFADPLIYDGSALFYKTTAPARPKSVADIVKLGVPVGTQSGGADLRTVLAAGVSPANIVQFDSDQTIVDGLLADRMPYALDAYSALRPILERRKPGNVEVVYPVVDDPPKGSTCAFRTVDTDLYEAYQRELKAMKASGAFEAILKQFGYDMPAELQRITIEEACAAAS